MNGKPWPRDTGMGLTQKRKAEEKPIAFDGYTENAVVNVTPIPQLEPARPVKGYGLWEVTEGCDKLSQVNISEHTSNVRHYVRPLE